jgi:hypothetical protein
MSSIPFQSHVNPPANWLVCSASKMRGRLRGAPPRHELSPKKIRVIANARGAMTVKASRLWVQSARTVLSGLLCTRWAKRGSGRQNSRFGMCRRTPSTAITVATLLGAMGNVSSLNPVKALVLAAVLNGIVAVPVMGILCL